MLVGNHRVHGVVQQLPKPMIVVGKTGAAADGAGGGDADEAGGGGGGVADGYVVRAVVRQRIVFKDRPQPIIGGTGAAKPRA